MGLRRMVNEVRLRGSAAGQRRAGTRLAALLVLLVALAACGGGEEPASDAPDPAATPDAGAEPTEAETAAGPGGGGETAAEPTDDGQGECGEITDITWSLPVTSAAQSLAPLAQAKGLFQQNCLSVQTPTVGGSQNAIAAAVGGETHLFNSDALNLTRSISQDLDIVIVAVPAVRPVFDLIVSTDIQEPSDLEGMRLGVSRIGNSTHFQLLRALETLGVDASTIQFISLDDYPGIYAGMVAGEIDGGMATIPFNERLIETGDFHRPIDLQEITEAAYPSSVAATTQRQIDENREVIVSALTAYVQAIDLFKEDPEAAKEVLADFLILDDQEELDLTQEWFAETFQDDPVPRVEDFESVAEHLRETENLDVTTESLSTGVNTELIEEAIERARG